MCPNLCWSTKERQLSYLPCSLLFLSSLSEYLNTCKTRSRRAILGPVQKKISKIKNRQLQRANCSFRLVGLQQTENTITWLKFCFQFKECRNAGTRERSNERTKEQKNEGTRERRNEDTKKQIMRRKEGTYKVEGTNIINGRRKVKTRNEGRKEGRKKQRGLRRRKERTIRELKGSLAMTTVTSGMTPCKKWIYILPAYLASV